MSALQVSIDIDDVSYEGRAVIWRGENEITEIPFGRSVGVALSDLLLYARAVPALPGTPDVSELTAPAADLAKAIIGAPVSPPAALVRALGAATTAETFVEGTLVTLNVTPADAAAAALGTVDTEAVEQ